MNPEIIIAGAGPVGLTLANHLGLHGIPTLVLEQQLEPHDGPRAVALDDECLRIWQQCDLIDSLAPYIAEGEEGEVVFTYRSRSGRPLFSMTQHGRPHGYARGNVFLFHRVLEVLEQGLSRYPQVELRRGWTVEDCQQEAKGISVTARDRLGQTQKFEAQYLVGCDGGRSRIRSALQIEMQGSAYAESWLIADTLNPELADLPLREGVEVWCDQRFPTASIPLPLGFRRWEFLLRHQYANAKPDEQLIRQLIEKRKPLAGAQLTRRLVHTYKASIARNYRQGRVFLAGDAAHLSPPFAGQGLATGLRDAANLAWKLAFVLQKKADPELLDSYEAERRPHQLRMLKLARRMGEMMMPKSLAHELAIASLFLIAGKLPWLRRAMEIRGANVTPIYDAAKKFRGARSGQLLIQPRLGDGTLLDTRLGHGYCLLGFDQPPAKNLSSEEAAFWQMRGARFLELSSKNEDAEAFQLFDRWLGGCRQRLLIVRPDRFIEEDRKIKDPE